MPITITADAASGNITVAPTLANYAAGDLVQWEAIGATRLTISFIKNGTPFDIGTFDGAAGTGSTTVERRILATAAKGHYHYGLRTTILGTDYEIPGCPEVVVG